MLVNTTRSATIVFRFYFISTLAKFHRKRHTRFAYVARIGPFRLNRATEGQTFCCTFSVGLHRTMAGSFREFQPPCRARRARVCAPYRARFLASARGTTAKRRRYANLSPVADAVGRIRRCQRSTCVTAALPAPRREWKIHFVDDLRPMKVAAIFASPTPAITMPSLAS